MLFSILAMHIYICTKSEEGFPFLHILVYILSFFFLFLSCLNLTRPPKINWERVSFLVLLDLSLPGSTRD